MYAAAASEVRVDLSRGGALPDGLVEHDPGAHGGVQRRDLAEHGDRDELVALGPHRPGYAPLLGTDDEHGGTRKVGLLVVRGVDGVQPDQPEAELL